jgi:diguanylate cyclase (GGDEF)-like protein
MRRRDMTDVVSSLQQFTAASSAGSFAAALAAVCLIQYVVHLYSSRRARRERLEIRRELRTAVARCTSLESARALAELETCTLRRLTSAATADEALGVVLELYAPDPRTELAVFFEWPPVGAPRRCASRGIDAESLPRITADSDWPSRLATSPALRLPQPDACRTTFYRRLSRADQAKVDDLFLLRMGGVGQPQGVLVTTALVPDGVAIAGRMELAERILATTGRLLRRTEALAQQQDELRLTRELLDLRCLVDTHVGTPIELLEEFLRRLATAAGFDRGTLYLATGTRLDPKPLVTMGEGLPRGLADLWRLDEAALARQGLESAGMVFLAAPDLAALGIRSTMRGALVAPLRHEDSLIGVVSLARQSDIPLAVGDRQLLKWGTDYLRETILRTVDRAIIEQQARRDALTQLANRHTFDREITRHVAESNHSGEECSLIMLDIDRFKRLNDQYGHLAGDEVLRTVARMVQSCVSRTRWADRPLVARYGGEELSVLLPGVGLDGAYRVAEDILETVRRKAIEAEGRVLRLTISGGVATCPLHAATPSGLIAAADAALYRAKQGGRDRCEVAFTRRGTSEPAMAYEAAESPGDWDAAG